MLTRKQLTYDDAMAIGQLPHVVAVSPILQYQDHSSPFGGGATTVKWNGHTVGNVSLQGSTPPDKDVANLEIVEGRFFNDNDITRAAKVAVLGHDTADDLFGIGNAVGKEITVAGEIFTVIGVRDKEKTAFGGGKNPDDNIVFMPLSTFHHMHPEILDYWITLKYDDSKNLPLVQDEITELLRRRRKVPNAAPDNFALFGMDSLTRLWTSLTGGLFLLLFALSSVALMVGGVGVMNIMLVSVTERTREIGVRKAIGATRSTIMAQFTLEAVTLCAICGIVGVVIGAGIATLLTFIVPSLVSLLWVIVAFGSACGIGLIFGIYPAYKAASLNPIEALRYE
jgi:putative ABC transport system permease protein